MHDRGASTSAQRDPPHEHRAAVADPGDLERPAEVVGASPGVAQAALGDLCGQADSVVGDPELEPVTGHEDVDLGAIQRASVDAGALFQVAHPTTYPEALFGSHCRGCEFTLDDAIDWDLVTSIEVLTGPVVLGEPPDYPNPFVSTALDRWRALPPADRPIIARGLSKKPDERWPTCAEMVRSLKLSGLPAPMNTPAPVPTQQARTYKVKRGDTLSGIAARFGTTVRVLIDLNDIKNPSRIAIGARLKLPPESP